MLFLLDYLHLCSDYFWYVCDLFYTFFACGFMNLLSYLEPSIKKSTAETIVNEIIWPVAVPKLRNIFYCYVVCHVSACSVKISRAPLFKRGELDINFTPVSVYWLNKALQKSHFVVNKCGAHFPFPLASSVLSS